MGGNVNLILLSPPAPKCFRAVFKIWKVETRIQGENILNTTHCAFNWVW